MPIFEYNCDACGKAFEALLPSHSAKATCPHCDSRKVSRQLSSFAAHGSPSTPCKDGACPLPNTASPCCGGGSCPIG